MQIAIFGGGCFWCTEAVFQTLVGVIRVTSGYMGGTLKHPTYMEICNGDTGHAEVIRIEFDPKIITFEELLLIFFKTHTPTTLNRQGNDVGSQYRSIIFYTNEEQLELIGKMIASLTREKVFEEKIVTEVLPAGDFYEAEDYHQDYYLSNKSKPYCAFVIQPKLNKFAKDFQNKIRPEFLE
ncbi:peptide-methionine (S)-S-oxide reductase MsrA [Pedobacter sp. AW1-32]|uniref:peptide-methionine (S)-S-oxide reductase MsrA n=1 Tax=Pedobacter sp. AW1-32 TaxID=3383026 RepID=UPI003FF0395B